MIRINRPATDAPAILRGRGQQETIHLCEQYDADPASYDSGELKFPAAKGDIYGAKSVKNALKKFQNNKCCYCEARFVRDAVSVEHYRPKAAIGIEGTNTKRYPGYYWLAYDWTNLLLCKFGVNSTKRDYFPLLDESTRAGNHNNDIGLESPMLIDPAAEDPREHIRYHDEEPYGITDRGKYTVDLLLRHPDLDENRREVFQNLKILKDALLVLETGGIASGKVDRIRNTLDDAILPDAIYSSMAMDLLVDENVE